MDNKYLVRALHAPACLLVLFNNKQALSMDLFGQHVVEIFNDAVVFLNTLVFVAFLILALILKNKAKAETYLMLSALVVLTWTHAVDVSSSIELQYSILIYVAKIITTVASIVAVVYWEHKRESP